MEQPCANLQQVVDYFANNSSDNELSIVVDEGMYGCENNTEILLPDVPVMITGTFVNSWPIFNCSLDTFLFQVQQSFTMDNIGVTGYSVGIQTNQFAGEEIVISNCSFLTSQFAIQIDSSIQTTFNLSEVEIIGGNVQIWQVANESVKTSSIRNCSFTTPDLFSLDISEGNWLIDGNSFNSSGGGVKYNSTQTNTLELYFLSLDNCTNGFQVNAPQSSVLDSYNSVLVSESGLVAVEIHSWRSNNSIYHANLYSPSINIVTHYEFQLLYVDVIGDVELNLLFNGNWDSGISHSEFSYGSTTIQVSSIAPVFISSKYSYAYGKPALTLYGNETKFTLANQFNNNRGTTAPGGGAVLAVNTTVDFGSTNFNNNTSEYAGGSVFAVGCDISLDHAYFYNSSAPYGGAVFLLDSKSFVDQSGTYTDGFAVSGAGLYFANRSNQTFTAQLTGTMISNNQANTSAAIACCNDNVTECHIQIDNENLSLIQNYNSQGGDTVSCTLLNSLSSADNSPAGTPSDDTSSLGVYILVGVLGGLLIVVAVGVIGYFIWSERKHKRYASIE